MRVHEFDDDVRADALDVAIEPLLERECGCGAAALFRGLAVRAAGGMRLLLVGRAVGDVDAAAVGLPAGEIRPAY